MLFRQVAMLSPQALGSLPRRVATRWLVYCSAIDDRIFSDGTDGPILRLAKETRVRDRNDTSRASWRAYVS